MLNSETDKLESYRVREWLKSIQTRCTFERMKDTYSKEELTGIARELITTWRNLMVLVGEEKERNLHPNPLPPGTEPEGKSNLQELQALGPAECAGFSTNTDTCSIPTPPKHNRRELLVDARRGRGMTQQKVAVAVDTSTVTVAKWEQGVVRPSQAFRYRLCKLFGMSEDELGIGKEEPIGTTEAIH